MLTKKATGAAVKKQKINARQVIAEKIDLALAEYKNGLAKKKYEKGLKKASKLLSKLVVVPMSKETNAKKSKAKAVASIK